MYGKPSRVGGLIGQLVYRHPRQLPGQLAARHVKGGQFVFQSGHGRRNYLRRQIDRHGAALKHLVGVGHPQHHLMVGAVA